MEQNNKESGLGSNIKKLYKKQHADFKKKYQSLIDKALSDKHLLEEKVRSKLKLIFSELIEQKIITIDQLEEKYENEYGIYCEASIANVIHIKSDGSYLKIEVDLDIIKNDTTISNVANFSDQEWLMLANQILGLVYKYVYNIQKLTEMKLFF